VTYEGTNQVKGTKINRLVHDYELFTMLENENISSMYARFNDIINALMGLGKVDANHELVSRILGHIRLDCPKLKKTNDKVKRKAMIATWSDSDDSSSDDEENEEIANIAFMELEKNCEVNTSSLSYNELQYEYDELLDVLNDLNREYLMLKKI
ncbi:UBN2 domain-containing protein, partial [Cephalotus follicularis]